MATSSVIILHFIVDARTTQKVTFVTHPESTEILKSFKRQAVFVLDKLDLDENFSIQYEVVLGPSPPLPNSSRDQVLKSIESESDLSLCP